MVDNIDTDKPHRYLEASREYTEKLEAETIARILKKIVYVKTVITHDFQWYKTLVCTRDFHMLETTANKLRKNLRLEVQHCVESHEVLRVKQQGGEDFVILSAMDWRAIEETLFLNQIPGMVDSLHSAAAEPFTKGTRLEDLDW
jgi:PHD/YefM family antitoxin component YafN of YafNO toxin-antitoxin module